MLVDLNELAQEYAKSYLDKTRIYFIEKYLSTFNAEKGKNSPFILFPRQKEFVRSITNYPASIAIKHRQAGITTVTSAWAAAQMVFASTEAPETILCIGNKLDLSQQLVTKIRDFLSQVPRWFWGDEYYDPDPKSPKNKKDIFIKNSKSELVLFNGSAVYARSSGANAARGISAVSILIFDEAAFIEDGLSVYSSAVAATASVPNRKIIMVSTPNGKDELYYDTYRKALAKENNYNAVEFKWYQDLRYNKHLKWYKKNEKTGEKEWIIEKELDDSGAVEYNEEKWRQLEKDGWTPISPWYEEMCKSFNNDPMKIAQELDVSFMGSANNVVSPEAIEMQEKENVREPLENMKDPMVQETWFWEPPIEGHRYILSCIPEGEEVLTNRGMVEVENILENDLLVTKDGEYTNTKKKMVRFVDGEKIVNLKPSNLCDFVSFTWNHPIYASCNTKLKRYSKKRGGKRFWDWDFKYVNAEDVQINDWVQMPNLYALNVLNDEEILSHWPKDATRIDFKIGNPLLNKDFWWFCGMWLAEGWVRENKHGNLSVWTCHNIIETDYIDKIQSIANAILGRKATTVIKEKYNTINCGISSKELSYFLLDNFGKYAKHKFISEWIKFLPTEYKIELVRGYIEGDGYVEKNKLYCGFTSISQKLLKDVQDILFSIGVISSLKLHVKEGYYNSKLRGGTINYCQNKYELGLCKYDTQELLNLLSIDSDVTLVNRRIIKDVVFSNDKKTIYFRITDKTEEKYTGNVYNFETESDSHTFCCRGIATHNCDPSRGDAADRTAIEVIDMDAKDENGLPVLTQAMEYIGRKLGDEVGQMIYNYATLYNDAFVVVDATGGVGDAALLTLLNLGYDKKNIFYDDPTLKKYTAASSQDFMKDEHDRMPGFHMQGNRYPMLSLFAGMIRNNEFKVRSIRVINELDTWIFKGETGRMDHMSGSHDDSLTCLAMGLFVMQYSFNKIEATKKKDSAILKAYMSGGKYTYIPRNKTIENGGSIRPKYNMPFYRPKNEGRTAGSGSQGAYLWLFSGYH